MHSTGPSSPTSSTSFQERTFVVEMELGLHLRSAALLVATASRYEAEVTIACDGEGVNGKSLLALVLLDAGQGKTLRVTTRGPDAVEAMSAISRVLGSGHAHERRLPPKTIARRYWEKAS